MKLENFLKDKDSMVFVIDEVGFGTKSLRRYAYSKIGVPAIRKAKCISKNLTCIATISTASVEFLKFIDGSGSRKEIFRDYFSSLITEMRKKYKDKKKFIYVLDNLAAHKCSLV